MILIAFIKFILRRIMKKAQLFITLVSLLMLQSRAVRFDDNQMESEYALAEVE